MNNIVSIQEDLESIYSEYDVNVIDDVEGRSDGVYMVVNREFVDYSSPPREIKEIMMGYGYEYDTWIADNSIDKDRVLFKFVSL